MENFPLLPLVSELRLRVCKTTTILEVRAGALINDVLATHHIFLQLSAGFR